MKTSELVPGLILQVVNTDETNNGTTGPWRIWNPSETTSMVLSTGDVVVITKHKEDVVRFGGGFIRMNEIMINGQVFRARSATLVKNTKKIKNNG